MQGEALNRIVTTETRRTAGHLTGVEIKACNILLLAASDPHRSP